ncbi:MAG: transposase [Candidatus Pacebacteria bacterium]|nr:transposase [Candidatus Paceibacterota bacterium]
MSYRKEELSNGEYYHIYNRGVDKRIIFNDKQDFFQFLQMLDLFNIDISCGAVKAYKYPINIEHRSKASVLVEIVAYCLNDNHYHLLLKQVMDGGISKFMQKIGTGYVKYFNQKHERGGSLFQGKFKSIHVGTDEYLKDLSAYINLNNVVHIETASKHRSKASVLYRSSWWEYGGKKEQGAFHTICEKDIILDAFKSKQDYMKFTKDYIKNIVKMRKDKLELNSDSEIFLE